MLELIKISYNCGRSLAGLKCLPVTEEIAGSNPVARAKSNLASQKLMLQLPLYTPQFNSNQFNVQDVLGAWVVIKPEYLWLFVLLVFVFFIAWSFILSYHWKKFGFEKQVMAKASVFYFSVSGGLLSAMILSLVVYLNSI